MDWEVVRSLASTIAVLVAAWQIWRSNRQAVVKFEDDIAKEYREMIRNIPINVYFGDDLSPEDKALARVHLYRYFELTNYQVFLRCQGRISASTWETWRDGIKANLQLSEVRSAWASISRESHITFSRLRRLIEEEYARDPRTWR
jgi:hypothetical protein